MGCPVGQLANRENKTYEDKKCKAEATKRSTHKAACRIVRCVIPATGLNPAAGGATGGETEGSGSPRSTDNPSG